MSRRTWFVVVGILTASVAPACCGISALGGSVHFHGQINLIVWDADSKTEHFIRDARFISDKKDFGFLAPSPTQPELEEVDGHVFDNLSRLQPVPLSLGCSARVAAGSKDRPAGAVEVVAEKEVAGYQTVVLKADDSKALADWLRERKYQLTANAEAWLKPYTDKGWYMTAFRVKNDGDVASTGTVRMTFKTDKPFNPYRVPADNFAPDGRNDGLFLFFVSAGSYRASIGSSSPWGEPAWEVPLKDDMRRQLVEDLRLATADVPENAWLSFYSDPSFPNAAQDDLFFVLRPFYAQPQFTESARWVTLVAVVVVIGWSMTRHRRPRTASA